MFVKMISIGISKKIFVVVPFGCLPVNLLFRNLLGIKADRLLVAILGKVSETTLDDGRSVQLSSHQSRRVHIFLLSPCLYSQPNQPPLVLQLHL